MNILITGGTGFIGEALVPALRDDGHVLTILTRQRLDGDGDGVRFVRDLDTLEDTFDGVINLAGASLAGRRWNRAYKEEIVSSRLDITRALGAYFSRAGYSPAVWLNASAVGFYGPRGEEPLTEDSAAGNSFSAQLCRDWEQAAREATHGATRLCLLRLGVVLDRDGGAYPQMALPFRLGVANWAGDGRQYLSWIHREDVVGAMRFLLERADCEGTFNVTAPQPVTSRAFCHAMKDVHRTFVTVPMPAVAMRMMVGEMADELLLTGQRVLPTHLQGADFPFRFPSLETALNAIECGD